MWKEVYRWLLVPALMLALLQPLGAAERRVLPGYSEFGDPGEETREAVTELLEAFKVSWANQDVEAHMALFAEDAEWINAYARMFRGKEELAVFLDDRLFPNFDPRVSMEEMANSKLLSIRYISDTAAVIHIATDGTRGESTIPGELMRRTHLHLVVENRQGVWLVVHTAIMDARV